MNIDISTIRIPALFRKNPPAEKKVIKKIEAILDNTIKPITLLEDKTLIDGYAAYVAYNRLDIRTVPVKFETVIGTAKLMSDDEVIDDMDKENYTLRSITRSIKNNKPSDEEMFNEKLYNSIVNTSPVIINFEKPLTKEEECIREITQRLLGGSKLGHLYKQQNGRCYICGRICTYPSRYGKKKKRDTNASIEHMIPRAFGGKNTDNNIRMTCNHCNGLKGCSRYTHYLQIKICEDLLNRGEISQEDFDYILGESKEVYYNGRKQTGKG